ncbi:hypothetical protein [Cohnella cellulosilytica]|uniref:hypothetical protein n=1 Tax=Cohnella cellulosilytica TaxID=986710 RepID=UPI00361756F3
MKAAREYMFNNFNVRMLPVEDVYVRTIIAFPNISTGIYGYPKVKSAEAALKTVADFIEKSTAVERIQFICSDRENYYG